MTSRSAAVITSALALSACDASAPPTVEEFTVLSVIDVGRNPHQIAFSHDGSIAYVAAAGSNWVAVVDVATHEVRDTIPTPGVPLGVAVLRDGHLAVTQFRASQVAKYNPQTKQPIATIETGVGGSLLVGPVNDGTYLLSVEEEDELLVLDGTSFTLSSRYASGARPFPPATTSDGRVGFVPGYDDSTVTVIDLWNQRDRGRTVVGSQPSGGAVLPGDIEYAIAVRGENKVIFVNTASGDVTGELTDGIGTGPFSVVLTPNGRLAFVNNTESDDVSVISTEDRTVIGRVPVGELPIVMAIHPNGETLWVSSEDADELTIIAIPDRWREDLLPVDASGTTEVAVLGMTHSGHLDSELWGLDEVMQTVRNFQPDVICAEIPPDRWEKTWRDLNERNVVEEPRVARFPEYVDGILHWARDEGVTVEPCAGWTDEMARLRQTRIREFNTDDEYADERQAYAAELQVVREQYGTAYGANDDPRHIHSDAYDEHARAELELYNKYQNDLIGPGGWTNINISHFDLIDKAIRKHRGKRVLITFGGGHKYWFLDQLRERDDVELLDIVPFLP